MVFSRYRRVAVSSVLRCESLGLRGCARGEGFTFALLFADEFNRELEFAIGSKFVA